MRTFTSQILSAVEEIPLPSAFNSEDADLLLVHGSRSAVESPQLFSKLRAAYPTALITGCSTAGEIENGELHQNSLVFAAIDFDSTQVRQVSRQPSATKLSTIAEEIVSELAAPDLKAILLYCDGLTIDGDELIQGFQRSVDKDVHFVGGLAADSLDFDRTYVINNEGAYSEMIVAIGLYGENLQVKSSSSNFSPDIQPVMVTKSDANVVLEIDNKPALEAYAEALGEDADILPGGSVCFPFILKDEEGRSTVCRTVAATEDDGSMIFAASVPEGEAGIVNLADPDKLIEDAKSVAQQVACPDSEFAIVINCAARRMAIGGALEETETAVIHNSIGNQVPTLGYYAYGEFGPCSTTEQVEMHNQTVTILTMHEV